MTHFIKQIIGMVVIATGVSAAAPAFAEAPDYVRVRNISYAGSGCPAGTVAGNVAVDRQAFTLLFDSYIAEVGPGVPFREKRKNCQLSLDLDYPRGWSFSIFTLDIRGYAALEPGVKATQQTTMYYQGGLNTGVLKSVLVGPRDQNYMVRDVLPLASQQWSPCQAQRALNLNTQIILDNSLDTRRRGLMTVDSIDGGVKLIYGVQWRRC